MGNISKALISNTEAEPNIVKFGRDRSPNTTTLQITENGEYDVRNYLKADVNVEGNPNYKETLTGTANALQISEETATELSSGEDASAFIMIDTSALQMGIPYISGPLIKNGIYWCMTYAEVKSTVAECNCYDIRWSILDGSISSAKGLMGGNILDMSPYMSLLPYVLKIYHHKMPEA